MKILVCGDRDWSDRELLRAMLVRFSTEGYNTVIEGEARGADKIGAEIAKSLEMTVCEYPANWAKYGKAAGPIRNRQMLDEKPDLVLAFHDDIKASKGTADTVREAKRRGIRCSIVSHSGVVEYD